MRYVGICAPAKRSDFGRRNGRALDAVQPELRLKASLRSVQRAVRLLWRRLKAEALFSAFRGA